MQDQLGTGTLLFIKVFPLGMYNDLGTRYVVSMNDTNDWEPTRHGGVRRTGVAQQLGTPEGHRVEAAGSAEPKVKMKRTPASTQEEHFRGSRAHNAKEGGGSNPSPGTPKFIFKWREELGLPTCPYLIRWRFETPWGSVRLHHWLGPDDDRAKHDHPWSFTTFVLKGGYTDLGVDGDQHLRAPAIQHRSAEHQHTVVPDEGGCWTIIVTSKKKRNWGFWVKGKFIKMNKYFLTYGHHPCD